LAQGTEEIWIELGYTRNFVIEDRRTVGDGAVGLAKRTPGLAAKTTVLAVKDVDGWCGDRRPGRRRGGGRQPLVAEGRGDRRDCDEESGDKDPGNPTGRRSCWSAVGHAAISGSAALPARMRFSIRRRYAPARSIGACAC